MLQIKTLGRSGITTKQEDPRCVDVIIILSCIHHDLKSVKTITTKNYAGKTLCRAHATYIPVFLGNLLRKRSILKFIFCYPGSFSEEWGMHNLNCGGQVAHGCWSFLLSDQQEKDTVYKFISSLSITTIYISPLRPSCLTHLFQLALLLIRGGCRREVRKSTCWGRTKQCCIN